MSFEFFVENLEIFISYTIEAGHGQRGQARSTNYSQFNCL